MGQEQYEAERLWLEAYFEFCSDIDLDVVAEQSRARSGVTLPEVLHVFRSPDVQSAERNHDGCIFCVIGRNCDDERVKVYGGFHSGTQLVSVFHVEKI